MSGWTRVVALAFVAVSSPARAETGFHWEAGVAGTFVASGEHRGFGAAASILRSAGRFFAIGATFDVSRLSADGTAGNGRPFEHAYASTLLAVDFQFRLPLGRVRPFVDLALGGTIVEGIRSENTNCRYESGLGVQAGAGVKVDVGDGIAVGLRAAARLPGGALACAGSFGPWGFDLAPLYSLGLTADFFW